jgi:hypothetical protein
MVRPRNPKTEGLTNVEIAELLAVEAESSKQPLQKALRRASRKAFLWEEEVAQLLSQRRCLQELPGVGPYLEKLIKRWMEQPPVGPEPPEIRKSFLSIPQARALLASTPAWLRELKGDLQMHSERSDGSDSVAEMAVAAATCGYRWRQRS